MSPAAARLHMQPTDDCFSICLLLHRVAESAAFTISVSGQVAATSSAPPAFLPTTYCSSSGCCGCFGWLQGGLDARRLRPARVQTVQWAQRGHHPRRGQRIPRPRLSKPHTHRERGCGARRLLSLAAAAAAPGGYEAAWRAAWSCKTALWATLAKRQGGGYGCTAREARVRVRPAVLAAPHMSATDASSCQHPAQPCWCVSKKSDAVHSAFSRVVCSSGRVHVCFLTALTALYTWVCVL